MALNTEIWEKEVLNKSFISAEFSHKDEAFLAIICVKVKIGAERINPREVSALNCEKSD